MTRAVLSIGSNLGDRLGYLRLAVSTLGPTVRAVSGVYETAPWGVTDQPDFLNAVVIVDDPVATPRAWLQRAREAEAAAERRRERRWGPRSLDVDIITVDGYRSTEQELTLPHPMAHQRAFVLLPWVELEPGAVLPGRGDLLTLLAALPAAERAGVHLLPAVVLT
ncbi:MAG: 2-amino-4-hydroxy-6-hydroxymethyldihydropteridine diphosphokinase [Sciscionella sp.]